TLTRTSRSPSPPRGSPCAAPVPRLAPPPWGGPGAVQCVRRGRGVLWQRPLQWPVPRGSMRLRGNTRRATTCRVVREVVPGACPAHNAPTTITPRACVQATVRAGHSTHVAYLHGQRHG